MANKPEDPNRPRPADKKTQHKPPTSDSSIEGLEGAVSAAREAAKKKEPGEFIPADEAIDFASRARGVRDRPQAGWESLTGTELAVVRQLTDGLTNAAIAEKMLISQGTVKAHLSHIFTKTGVSNRAELAALAARHLSTSPESERESQSAGDASVGRPPGAPSSRHL